MSISVLNKARLALSVMAVTVFSALVLVGCAKDEEETPPPGLDSKLVCAEGEAWVIDDIIGTILKGDGSFVMAINYGPDMPSAVQTGTWSTSGSNIIMKTTWVAPDDPLGGKVGTQTIPYTVSGDGKTATFTMDGQKQTATKTSGITVPSE